jgi:sugar-specific transcriptional regulator TrmB
MLNKEEDELIHYLQDIHSKVKELVSECSDRNKTKKFLAIRSLLMITEAKIHSTIQYARAGGYSELSVITQKHLYDPVIRWLRAEIRS